MAAVEEKLARDSDPQPLNRKRVRYVLFGAGVGIEAIPQRRSGVRDDFRRHARTFSSRSRLTERDVNVVPLQKRVLTVDALAPEAEREGVVVLRVEYKT